MSSLSFYNFDNRIGQVGCIYGLTGIPIGILKECHSQLFLTSEKVHIGLLTCEMRVHQIFFLLTDVTHCSASPGPKC